MNATAEIVNEYRCTRPAVYQCNCPGRTNLGAREGHYIRATSEAAARQRMAEKFPEDAQAGFGFDVQLWKKDIQPDGSYTL